MNEHLAEKYAAIFEKERQNRYPDVELYEKLNGFAVDTERLEAAARVLACPLKINPPNWQHGRILYATARKYLEMRRAASTFLDIGTAKGFSACVLSWAIADAGIEPLCRVVSIDVVQPESRVPRNSVNDGQTVQEYVAPFVAEGVSVEFVGGGSEAWLKNTKERVNLAFVDGKHSYEAVVNDHMRLAKLQQPGDVIVFDDIQIEPVNKAVGVVRGYSVAKLNAKADRRYAIAVKR